MRTGGRNDLIARQADPEPRRPFHRVRQAPRIDPRFFSDERDLELLGRR